MLVDNLTGKAAENIYFSQEDEKLMKKMLEENPELDSKFASGDASSMGETTEEKVCVNTWHY